MFKGDEDKLTSLIELKNITKTFRTRGGLGSKKLIKAVDNISFNIHENETLTLVGESGCGKSTLGKLAVALLKPDSGQIFYEGKDVWSLEKKEFSTFRHSAQIIHQDPYSSLNPMRTVFQSLSPPLMHFKIARGMDETWKMSADLLRAVSLEPADDFLRRYPSRLSGGQMQRVSIARAISVRPKFIVADEVTSMVDAELRVGIVDLLLDLREKFNMAYLFITHDLSLARYFGREGKVMVMYLGSVMEMGGMEDIIHRPLHPYTSILLSVVPIPDPKVSRQRGLPPIRSLEVPRLTEIPSGCKFHPRCPYARVICMNEVPALREVREGHFAACHFVEELENSFLRN